MKIKNINTLGELKSSGYKPKTIKDELRDNLIKALQNKEPLFAEIKGYDDTVIPQLQTAILSGHSILLLGLRGQAKTRIARLMTNLLDEYIPVVSGTDLNDDPMNPLSRTAKNIIEDLGDKTPVAWIHRSERYTEKLATPDVSVADLIGDVDPIKAASMKLTYADERVIHYGLIARSNRSIFVINELPDLQPRIQVALFNVLQEGDIQIRGFKLRLPLDIQFVFTANPEDYTNRGSIITPLKDRIGSQILTHYPKTIETSGIITAQEARITHEQRNKITMNPLLLMLIEQIAMEARQSDLIDQKSGVSARLTISALENLYSACERRMLLNNESSTQARINDLYSIIPSITGKVELVYEGELEGIQNVAYTLIGKAIRNVFLKYFPDPEKIKKSKKDNVFSSVVMWFSEGNESDIGFMATNNDYEKNLRNVKGLAETVKSLHGKVKDDELLLRMEFLLHGMAEFSQISKLQISSGMQFKDLMGSMLNFRLDHDAED
ncbi:MAG: sigma 54-interacting transcriptional regulator [Bacteroidetes bacterium]|jgi:magnesium chelatase subunit I|nr:sigma 54-interacting transcriptional regulator [Bacteroidota bacterium]